jgi:anti-sigma factor RsiW
MIRRRSGLSCAELVELVTDYLEGALPRRERRRFEAHIRKCDGCTNYLEQIRLTIAATGRLTEETIAPEVRDALLDVFRDWKAQGAG